MQTWKTPNIHSLPPASGNVRLTDTQSGNILDPFESGKLDLYVCGITPYDAAHVGHLFTYLIFDTIVRIALDFGYRVNYVENITDIDDPLFERARQEGKSWDEIAIPQIDLFRNAMEKMRIIPPNSFLSVTESMSHIIETVEKASTLTYQINQDTYFKSNTDGLVSFTQKSVSELISISKQRGGDPETLGKLNSLDPKIWVDSADDEPSWSSALGQGRPGWHIECIAIADSIFKSTFDLQGGGMDLMFPHHAFCDQMNKQIFGRPLARGYLHVELVGYRGEKMSKSLGNLVFVQDLFDRKYSINEIRLALLSQDWKAYWEFDYILIEEAKERLDLWEKAVCSGLFPDFKTIRSILNVHLYQNLDISAAINAIDSSIVQQEKAVDVTQSLELISNIFGIELQQ